MAATVTSAALLHVVFDHVGDVHAVDVIAAEDRHHVRVGLLHQVDVLVDGVGRSLVPGFVRGAHLGRHRNHELRFEQAAELPSLAQVLQQRLAAELRQHIDRVDAGVDEITQDEIDDPVFPAERNGRFGPFLGKREEPGALASRQHDSQYAYAHAFHQRPIVSGRRRGWQGETSGCHPPASGRRGIEWSNMTDRGFREAAVIGTGMMGPGIALTLALGGLRTTILSRTGENAARGLEKARAQARLLAENELADRARTEAGGGVAERLHGVRRDHRRRGPGGGVRPRGYGVQTGAIRPPGRVAGPRALLASNTSGLSITAVAARCARPERVLTAHFWNPPHLMPLVEIVKGAKTSDEAAEALRAVLVECGKTPVVVRKDRPGQLGNRLQMALVREAAYIVAEGIASAEDVDTVARNGFGLRMPAYGILEHQDVVGLNMGLAVVEYVARDLYNEPRAPEYFRELVRRGELGASTGKGFYDWSVKSADEVRARRDAFLIEVLRYRRRKHARRT